MVDDIAIDKSLELSYNNILSADLNDKKQITLCDSKRKDLHHYRYWVNRLDGRYKATTPFTVDKDGSIYQHYNSYYTSFILGNKILDSRNIYITLVNESWVEPTSGGYENWVGELIDEEPFECEWRRKDYWAPYTKEQFESVIELCKYLCNEHNIPKKTVSGNTFFNYVDDFTGIAYKSNYNPIYKDINPSWYFKDFKKEIEENE